MTTDTAAQPKRREGLQRLRNLFSRSSAVPDQINLAPSTSPLAPKSVASKPTSSTPAIARSSLHRNSNADPRARPASPADQTVPSASRCPLEASALGQDLLEKALELLKKKERATIQDYILRNTEDIDSAVRDALKAAQEKREICKKKSWTFSFRGHIVKLREEADRIIFWLERFKQVGDVAVNADLIHAGLPWAGIRLLLEVREDYN